MKNRLIMIAAALVAVLALALPAAAARQAPSAVHCPKGKLVVNVTEKVAEHLGYASYYNDLSGPPLRCRTTTASSRPGRSDRAAIVLK